MHPSKIRPADIAAAMAMTEVECWAFARNIERGFKPERNQRVGTKVRIIDAPFCGTKKRLKRLHRWMQSLALSHPTAHGGVSRRSCFTSARCHIHRRFVWTRDASNCYPSVSPAAFFHELKKLGFHHDTAILLTQLCTVRGRIPQGSPVSGDAINLLFWQIDQFAASSAGAAKLGYSRVADDFVVSGNSKSRGDGLVLKIERAVEARNIKINDKKRRKIGLQNGSAPQLVHNIRVDKKAGTQICEDHHRTAIDLAKSFVESCHRLQPSSIEATAAKRQRVVGYMHYFRQATLSSATHLRQQLELGDRIVLRKLKALKLTATRNKWWLVKPRNNEPRRLAAAWVSRFSALAT